MFSQSSTQYRGEVSRLAHLEKFRLHFSSSSLAIRVNTSGGSKGEATPPPPSLF